MRRLALDLVSGFGKLLTAFGSRGPALLVVALLAGYFVPALSRGGHALLPLSAFLLTLGSFLSAAWTTDERAPSLALAMAVIAWVGLAMPLAAFAAAEITNVDPAYRNALILSLVAPPVGSAAAIAAMLGLRPRLALVTSILLTLLTPLSMPVLAELLGIRLEMQFGELAGRLFLIVGAAALLSALASRYRAAVAPLLPNRLAGAGIAVVGLMIVGIAMADGIRARSTGEGPAFGALLTMVVAINLAGCLIGTLMFARLGLQAAATVGLLTGNRNVTLAWAAAGTALPPQGEAYLAACVIPVLALPLCLQCVQKLAPVLRKAWSHRSGGH